MRRTIEQRIGRAARQRIGIVQLLRDASQLLRAQPLDLARRKSRIAHDIGEQRKRRAHRRCQRIQADIGPVAVESGRYTRTQPLLRLGQRSRIERRCALVH